MTTYTDTALWISLHVSDVLEHLSKAWSSSHYRRGEFFYMYYSTGFNIVTPSLPVCAWEKHWAMCLCAPLTLCLLRQWYTYLTWCHEKMNGDEEFHSELPRVCPVMLMGLKYCITICVHEPLKTFGWTQLPFLESYNWWCCLAPGWPV